MTRKENATGEIASTAASIEEAQEVEKARKAAFNSLAFLYIPRGEKEGGNLDTYINSLHDLDEAETLEEVQAGKEKALKTWAEIISKATDERIIKKSYFDAKEHQAPGGSETLEALKAALSEEQKEKLEAEYKRHIEVLKNAGALQYRAKAVKERLEQELKKPEYKGVLIEDLLNAPDPERLADENDEKTKLLLKALATAERATHQPERKITEAAKAEAKKEGAIYYQPKEIITVTDKNYKGGTSFYNTDGTATLTTLKPEVEIEHNENGLLFFPAIGEKSAVELEDTITHELVDSIDLPLLRTFYTYIVEKAQREIKEGEKPTLDGKLTIDVETLADELGESRTASKRARDKVIAAAKAFHNIAGKLVYSKTAVPSYYQVLNFESFDSAHNTITVRAPYLAYLFHEVYQTNLRRDLEGRIERDKDGTMLTKAYHGYGITNEIQKKYRRNKAVLESLFILDEVIEAGGKRPNITAKEIINRNIYLQDLLNNKPTMRQNQTLKRIFTQTWQALRETRLTDGPEGMYSRISLPDPEDPKNIPTIQNIEMCFYFDNEGKKKGQDETES